ncbi:MAG: hypothetical protein MUP14_03635 [Dehalococcoidia bacterium]|nr:hypothetical protein [Dehalococcoidia bacterium]
MPRMYEVLLYNGWQDVPAYYLVDSVEGRRPKEALAKQLSKVIANVRREFALGPDIGDRYISESLYALRSNGLVSARDVAPSP